MANLYSKALSFAVGGYSIIPLKKDKRPQISSWLKFQKEAATEEQIEGWWQKNPEANIGIVTGAISGITVVDIDTHDKENTVPLETFPPTLTIQTPSGGYHLYYLYDPDIKQTANTYSQFPHVDIRNDGGYVVGEGSITAYVEKGKKKGGTYKTLHQRELAAFPRDLFIKEEHSKTTGKLGKQLSSINTMQDGDGRNVALARLLGTILRGQPKSAYSELKQQFEAICSGMSHPVPEKEVKSIWESIGARAFEKASVLDLIVNDKGVPYQNLENLKIILSKDESFMGRVVFDRFLQVYLYRKDDKSKYADLHDSDETTITREISVKHPYFAMVHPALVRMAIMEQARENSVDCALDYIKSLKWDKINRLDQWLQKVYGVEDNEYHRSVGSNWLKGLVKRIVQPGSKFDYVLVLEGPQGTKKSTSLGVLGGDWHVETTAAPDNKDFLMLLQGNLIIEFSEGETLSRGEIKQLKAVITTQYDKFRAPYERHVQSHPRRCVFAMTTNQSEYLKDETGNRRWLPVSTKQMADIEWLRTNKDQLLAEAHYRVVELDETTYEFPESVLEEQYKRQVTDPNEGRVVEWYHTVLSAEQRQSGVTPHMAFVGALGMLQVKFNKRDEMEMTNIFRYSLGLQKVRAMVKKMRVTRWIDPEQKVEEFETKTVAEIDQDF